MTIVIFSSVLNHHSIPLCDALNRQPGVNCYFVSTQEEEDERRQLGYHGYERNYCINMLQSDESKKKACKLALTADVMIASVFPYDLLKERLERNKLTFLCQERMFKGGVTLMRKARAWQFNMRKFFRFRNKPLYFLSIGKYAASDYKSIGFYKNKCFEWAYFTDTITYDLPQLMEKKKGDAVEILFVGRLISWKHPEYSLRAAKELLAGGYDIHLTYVGCGDLEDNLRKEAETMGARVSFMGSMPPEEVRSYMEKANILAFTSNNLEGWGAVVNEAMNSGCAVIAGSAPGAVATMITDGENGLVYEGEDYDVFYQKLERLVADRELTRKIGEAAYHTITMRYNAEVAAQRFCRQADALLRGEALVDYSDGPMRKYK